MLGWFTRPFLELLGHPLRSGHDKVAIPGYALPKGIEEYHNQYLAFPEPSLLATLSDTAKQLEYSVGFFESPTSEELAKGLRDAATTLRRFRPETHEMDTGDNITTLIETINRIKEQSVDVQTVLMDMRSVAFGINNSIRIEREMLENDQTDVGDVRYFFKRLKMVWLGVAGYRSDGRWEYDVLDRCQTMVYVMSAIESISWATMSGLNSTLQTIRSDAGIE